MPVTQKRTATLSDTAALEPKTSKRRKELESVLSSAPRLPHGAELQELLAVQFGDPVETLLETALFAPIHDLTGRLGKQLRGRLVKLGCRLASPHTPMSEALKRRCRLGAQIVELIHAGSLIVDDIEDGSKVRRGEPTLHLQYGLPQALNAGNWLYFWPFQLSKQMELPEGRELLLYRTYHRTLLRAHFGQALDLGIGIDSLEQSRVPGIVLSSMELKTGALIAFALVLGGIMAGASEKLSQALDEFGHGFGMGLQMFDDLGNLNGRVEPAKKFEDLLMRRPSWVWACAARVCSEKEYGEFVAAVQELPEEERLENWLKCHNLYGLGKRRAHAHLKRVFAKFTLHLGRESDPEALDELSEMARQLERTYG